MGQEMIKNGTIDESDFVEKKRRQKATKTLWNFVKNVTVLTRINGIIIHILTPVPGDSDF